MAAAVAAPRYSADDFETTSIRSAAPSYASEAPSYYSNPPPSYTPPEPQNRSSNLVESVRPRNQHSSSSQDSSSTGLPPIPPIPAAGVPSLHNYRIPTWSMRNAPAARQLRSVVERRVNAGLQPGLSGSAGAGSGSDAAARRGPGSSRGSQSDEPVLRPLEDPYLVGERAAAQAKRERLARERSDLLEREDEQWVWLFQHMTGLNERERSWSSFRRGVDTGRRRSPLQRLGSRLV